MSTSGVNTKESTADTKDSKTSHANELSATKTLLSMQRMAFDPLDRRTVQLSKEAHRLFSLACERPPVRRSMFDVATRLMTWFSRQAPIVQTAITSDVDRGMERAYAEALRRLADELDDRASGRPPRFDAASLQPLPPGATPPKAVPVNIKPPKK